MHAPGCNSLPAGWPLARKGDALIHPYVLKQQLEHQVGIRGIASFKFCHLWLPYHLKLHGCCLKAGAKAFLKQIFLWLWMYQWPFLYWGTCGICGIHSTSCSAGLPNTMGIDVAMLANQNHLWGVTRTSAPARMSSKVSLLIVNGPLRLGTWPVIDAAPLLVFTIPGR